MFAINVRIPKRHRETTDLNETLHAKRQLIIRDYVGKGMKPLTKTTVPGVMRTAGVIIDPGIIVNRVHHSRQCFGKLDTADVEKADIVRQY